MIKEDNGVCGCCKYHCFCSPLRINILPWRRNQPTVESKIVGSLASNFQIPRPRELSFACCYWLISKVSDLHLHRSGTTVIYLFWLASLMQSDRHVRCSFYVSCYFNLYSVLTRTMKEMCNKGVATPC